MGLNLFLTSWSYSQKKKIENPDITKMTHKDRHIYQGLYIYIYINAKTTTDFST